MVATEGLERFIWATEWCPVKGAYMFPLHFFGPERSADPNDYLEVIRVFDVDGVPLAVSRGSGLFVRIKPNAARDEYLERVAEVLNLFLCELALAGVSSHPVTDIDIQDGMIIGRHAAILGGWGGHGSQTWGPFFMLASLPCRFENRGGSATYWGPNAYWMTTDVGERVLDEVDGFRRALRLREVGRQVPQLLVAAAYHTSRHNLPEAVLSAWILCESLIAELWDGHLAAVGDPRRLKRLKDTRTYSASVQIEVLQEARKIPDDLADRLHVARVARNNLAHRVRVTTDDVASCTGALIEFLNFSGIDANRLPGFSRQSGGRPPPGNVLEPDFDFPLASEFD